MAENSVGTISLDLVIQNQVEGQLEKIRNDVSCFAKQLGENIESSIEAPMKDAAENVQKKLGSSFEEASKTAQKATDKMTESFDNGIEEAVQEAHKRMDEQNANIARMQNEVGKFSQKIGESIETSIEAPIKKISENTQNTLDSISEKTTKTVEKTTRNTFKTIDEAYQKAKKNVAALKEYYKNNPAELAKLEKDVASGNIGKYANYDTSAIEAVNNVGIKIDSQFQSIFDRLKNFKIPTTPVEHLETELENKRTKTALLQKQWQELSMAEPSEKIISQMMKFQQQIIATQTTSKRLESQLSALNNANISDVINQIKNTLSKFANFKIPSSFTDFLHERLEKTQTKISSLQNQLRKLSMAEPTEKITKQMTEIQQQIDNARKKSEKLEERLSKFDLSIAKQSLNEFISFITAGFRGLLNTTLMPIQAIAKGILNIGKACHSVYEKIKYYLENPLYAVRDAAKAVFSTIRKVGSKAFSILKLVGGKALDSLKSRFGFLNKSAISLTKPIKKLGTTLKNTFRRVFIMATLYAAVKEIKNSFSEILKSNDELSKSLNDVKANLSIAFTPVIQAVMPALNTMMSGLAKATRYIAGFTAGLFGMTYKQAAEATQKLKNTSKTAEDTAKEISLSLAGIDEMNILSDNSNDSASEEDTGIDFSNLDMSEPELPDWAERLKKAIKSGDWSGVGEILVERVNAVFDGINWENIEKKITAKINKICDFINGFVDNLNFEYLGNALAGGLNIITSAINAFSDNIHWETIGSGLANGLNQAVKKIKWKQLGKSISAKIRILTDLLYGFITEINWQELGNGIGEAINGWFNGIDFGKLAITISEGIKGIFSTATSLLQTIDFSSFGSELAKFINNIDIEGILIGISTLADKIVKGLFDFLMSFLRNTDWISLGEQIFNGITGMIENIDWKNLIENAFELLGAAVGGISALISSLLIKIWEKLKEAWNSVKEYFNKKIEECGGNVIKGVFKGIVDALKNIGKWINEHIFKPFIDGFKTAFGIHSPSKKMAEMGGYIIAGLFNSISDGITKIREIFEKMLETIKTVFSDIGKWFKNKFSSAWNKIKSVWNDVNGYFSGIWDGITFTFSVAGNWFGEKFQSAWNNIKNIFSEVKGFFEGVWNGITNVFSHVTNWFRDTFSSAWEAVKNVFSKGGEIFTGITDGIAETFKTVVNGLIDGINWVIEQPFNAINWALDGIRGIEILDWYPFEWLPSIDVPQIPRLANGGLATAPTLAMVGDNRNAKSDPEVIAPLSKLEGMIGNNSEITEMLKIIIELLKNGTNIEIINYLFRNSHEFSREVIKAVAEDNIRRGEK